MIAQAKTVPCLYCSKPTNMLGTKLCDGCWELRARVLSNPKLAIQMLKEIAEEIPTTQMSNGYQIVLLRATLTKVAKQFRFYEEQHWAKKTKAADDKAVVNAHLAQECEDTLEATK